MNSYRGNGRKRKTRRKRKCLNAVRRKPYAAAGSLVLVILTVALGVYSCASGKGRYADVDASDPERDVQLLDVNPYSRPGLQTEGIKGVVIPHTSHPGRTSQSNR